jgi:hypothetical protein
LCCDSFFQANPSHGAARWWRSCTASPAAAAVSPLGDQLHHGVHPQPTTLALSRPRHAASVTPAVACRELLSPLPFGGGTRHFPGAAANQMPACLPPSGAGPTIKAWRTQPRCSLELEARLTVCPAPPELYIMRHPPLPY